MSFWIFQGNFELLLIVGSQNSESGSKTSCIVIKVVIDGLHIEVAAIYCSRIAFAAELSLEILLDNRLAILCPSKAKSTREKKQTEGVS